MSYCILRTAKLKTPTNIAASLSHTFRDRSRTMLIQPGVWTMTVSTCPVLHDAAPQAFSNNQNRKKYIHEKIKLFLKMHSYIKLIFLNYLVVTILIQSFLCRKLIQHRS